MKVMLQYPIAGEDARTIVENVEEGIRRGRIPSGVSLPTVRALATSLKVSPTTVAAAYRILQTRGLLIAQGRRGAGQRPVLESKRYKQTR